MRWVTFLAKLNRVAAWTAIATVILFVITGYGMTKRIIDPALAKRWHEEILPIPLFLALIVHGGISLRHAMWRWRVFSSRRVDDAFVLLVACVFLALFLWMHWR